MVKNTESIRERYIRRILRGEYKRSEDVMLYPISFFVSFDVVPLPLPVFTSNRDYLTARAGRRVFSIIGRVVQIILSALLCTVLLVAITNFINTGQYSLLHMLVIIGSVLVVIFSVFHIALSISYTKWLIKNFRSSWSKLRY